MVEAFEIVVHAAIVFAVVDGLLIVMTAVVAAEVVVVAAAVEVAVQN